MLLAVTLVPAAPAEDAGPPGTEGDAFRAIRTYSDGIFPAADFHPDGERALVAGGTRLDEYEPTRYLLSYDGDEWRTVNRFTSRLGPFMDVEWRPQGDYALVVGYRNSVIRCDAPCTESRDHFQNVQLPGSFYGFEVAWHPSGEHALLAGSSLLRWNGTGIQVVSPGAEAYFNTVAWHPSGDYALVQKGPPPTQIHRCDAPCGPGAVLTPVANFGKFGSGAAAVEHIAFHPDGTRAYVTGVDATHGLVLEIGLNGDSALDWSTRYIDPDKYGEITGMAFNPVDGSALLTSSLERQVMGYDAATDNITDLLDASSSLKVNGAAWHPNGTFALLPTRGGFIRYDPQGVPAVNITAPEADSEALGVVNVTGVAYPNLDEGPVDRVEYRVGHWKGTDAQRRVLLWSDWQPANHTGDAHQSAWWFHWNASDAPHGDHVLSVRAWDGGIPGGHDAVRVVVPDPNAGEQPDVPSLHLTNNTASGGGFALNWTAVERAAVYTVEEAMEEYFLNATIVYNGSNLHVTVDRSKPGDYYYRVRAVASDGVASYWSSSATATIEAPPDAPGNETDDGDGSQDGAGDGEDDAATNTSIPPTDGDPPGNDTDPDDGTPGDADPGNDADPGAGDPPGTGGEDTDPSPGNGSTTNGLTRGIPAPPAVLGVAIMAAAALALGARRTGLRND